MDTEEEINKKKEEKREEARVNLLLIIGYTAGLEVLGCMPKFTDGRRVSQNLSEIYNVIFHEK